MNDLLKKGKKKNETNNTQGYLSYVENETESCKVPVKQRKNHAGKKNSKGHQTFD